MRGGGPKAQRLSRLPIALKWGLKAAGIWLTFQTLTFRKSLTKNIELFLFFWPLKVRCLQNWAPQQCLWPQFFYCRILFFYNIGDVYIKMPQSGLCSMRGSTNVALHKRLSSMEGHLPLKVVFHWWLSSTEVGLPTEGCLLTKVVFLQRFSCTKDCLPPKAVFHQRLSSTYHNHFVVLIFVRAVNIPN